MSKLSEQSFLTLSLLLTILTCDIAFANPILSCSQTPYPQVCTSMMSTTIATDKLLQGKSRASFRDLVLKSTLDHAILTHRLASLANPSSFDARSKSAWLDCLELYQDTIQQLNHSMTASSSYEDSQTWLSAAVANQETCRGGFVELGLSARLKSSPFFANNVSESIINTLAINKATITISNISKGNRRLLNLNGVFPGWVSQKDRKLLQSSSVKADIVVAKDGSGNYKTISEAIAASSKLRKGTSRFVIHVKAGVYKENVEVKKSMKNLMIVGDGVDKTIVTASKNVQDGSTTFRSATFAVTGEGFIARDMTFENSAGPQKHQAVALRSGSDLSVFYRCSFKGYQDTLYVHSLRQFYRNCDIYGTVDFIFGDAVTVLQNCNIYILKPMNKQKNTITAQGRKDPNENTGIVIHNSVITAASNLKPVQGSFKSYLGRPWKEYSRTVIMKTKIDSLIDQAGWLEWSGDFALSTLDYGEYMNTGPGSSTSNRVKWPGYHVITRASEAEKFTVGKFLMGNQWIPATGVPFTASL